MDQVILSGRLNQKLLDLVDILYDDAYFSHKHLAKAYVDEIYKFIYSIPIQKHYTTQHPRYGRCYARYKPNKHTTYYITFDTNGKTYLVKNIISNHTPDYPRYIKGV